MKRIVVEVWRDNGDEPMSYMVEHAMICAENMIGDRASRGTAHDPADGGFGWRWETTDEPEVKA